MTPDARSPSPLSDAVCADAEHLIKAFDQALDAGATLHALQVLDVALGDAIRRHGARADSCAEARSARAA